MSMSVYINVTALVCWLTCVHAYAQSFQANVAPLIESSCIHCHDGETKTRLNFEALARDLSDRDTFKTWERIYERVKNGEMPPRSMPRRNRRCSKRRLSR